MYVCMYSEESKKEPPNVQKKKIPSNAWIHSSRSWRSWKKEYTYRFYRAVSKKKRYVSCLSCRIENNYPSKNRNYLLRLAGSITASTLSYVDSRRGRSAGIPFNTLWLLSSITPFSDSSESSDNRGGEDDDDDSSFRTCSRGRCSSSILSGICEKMDS